jgi:ammonia channel protein AmtB
VVLGDFFFMQAGFALIESGSVRSKNTVNVLMKTIWIPVLGDWYFGYLLWSNVWVESNGLDRSESFYAGSNG